MLIVNLTTTRARLPMARYTLLSLLLQTLKPDRIVLWLSRQPYLKDEGITELPAWLEEMMSQYPHLHVEWTDNTGPYRKLLPVLSSCADEDEIVTADDDILYGEHWLSMLVMAHRSSPGNIAACRVMAIRRNVFGKPTSYLAWPIIRSSGVIRKDFIVTFGGGAVLKKHHIQAGLLQDKAYTDIAPTTDDLWYSKLLLLSNTPVNVVSEALDELYFIQHDTGLSHQNRNTPKTWWQRVVSRQKQRFLGRLGYPICGNDIAYRNIDRYFSGSGQTQPVRGQQ